MRHGVRSLVASAVLGTACQAPDRPRSPSVAEQPLTVGRWPVSDERARNTRHSGRGYRAGRLGSKSPVAWGVVRRPSLLIDSGDRASRAHPTAGWCFGSRRKVLATPLGPDGLTPGEPTTASSDVTAASDPMRSCVSVGRLPRWRAVASLWPTDARPSRSAAGEASGCLLSPDRPQRGGHEPIVAAVLVAGLWWTRCRSRRRREVRTP